MFFQRRRWVCRWRRLQFQADRRYVTSDKPGHLHVFDLSAGTAKPKLRKSIPAAQGAPHVAFTKDGRSAYAQNMLLNLPGMSDGSIMVVDLNTEQVIGRIDTLKNAGFNRNRMALMPEWNEPAGH
jgi:6-phosphogluconolactonase (cycloisomerase 2 family)